MSDEQKRKDAATDRPDGLPEDDKGFLSLLQKLGKEAGNNRGIGGLAVLFKTRTTMIKGNRTEIRERDIGFDATDIIAFCAGGIAFTFAIAMVMNWLPLNKMTVSVVTFAAVAPALARLAQAISKPSKRR
jgi:hypothetical protein